MKAGLKPKEEAMGSVPNPPHALFVSFYFGPTFALLLHFNNNNNNTKKKTKKKQLLCMLLNVFSSIQKKKDAQFLLLSNKKYLKNMQCL